MPVCRKTHEDAVTVIAGKAKCAYVLPEFYLRWYQSIDWRNDVKYRGIPIMKSPSDLFAYHMIIQECRPDVIVEIGTGKGGSALYFLDQLRLAGGICVVTIDDGSHGYPVLDGGTGLLSQQGLVFVHGESTSQDVSNTVRAILTPPQSDLPPAKVMVIIDGDHHEGVVSEELKLYAPLVTVGQYLVCEDTNASLVTDHYPDGGPAEAVRRFLETTDEFWVDERHERIGLSFNPGGFLKRVA